MYSSEIPNMQLKKYGLNFLKITPRSRTQLLDLDIDLVDKTSKEFQTNHPQSSKTARDPESSKRLIMRNLDDSASFLGE